MGAVIKYNNPEPNYEGVSVIHGSKILALTSDDQWVELKDVTKVEMSHTANEIAEITITLTLDTEVQMDIDNIEEIMNKRKLNRKKT